MPNWIEGQLRIRGTNANIFRFLKDIEAITYEYPGTKETRKVVKLGDLKGAIKTSDGWTRVYGDNSHLLHFPGSKRAFMEGSDGDGSSLYFHFENGDEDKENALAVPFKQAWNVNAEYLAGLSKEYRLELRIIAVDQGSFKVTKVHVASGDILIDSTRIFDNYVDFVMECDTPLYGG